MGSSISKFLRIGRQDTILGNTRSGLAGLWRALAVLDSDNEVPNEIGAVLILALIFVIVVTLSILGLITFGGTGILNATNLQGERSLEFAADGATTAAIQAVRYSYNTFNQTSEQDCLPDGPVLTMPDNQTMTINHIAMTVDCSEAPPPLPSSINRVVIFDACQNAPCIASNSVVVATVYFDDTAPSDAYDCSAATNSSTCGSGLTIDSWVVESANS
jgi:hypothetical protein